APALARGLRVVRREKPQVLYATGGPWTTFLVARDLSALTGVPLVVDYRDPWTSNPATPRTGSVFENLAHSLEASGARRARVLVANTDVLRDTLLESQGAELCDKIAVVPNSCDASDSASPAPAPEPVFTFAYVGAMYDAHSPEPLLAGLVRLFADAPHWRRRFQVRLVGNGAPRV